MKRQEYLIAMAGSRQFSFYGITPFWTPGTKDIYGFIHDEVVRQFHDPRVKEDGGDRITWMQNAWDYALEVSKERRPTIEDILTVAGHVEPQINASGFRRVFVRIGDHIAPDPVDVPRLMETLWTTIDLVKPVAERGWFYNRPDVEAPTADDFYLEFERIHPFGDGNGRTGKILHNWLLGTLEDPVLVKDYFNGGNP